MSAKVNRVFHCRLLGTGFVLRFFPQSEYREKICGENYNSETVKLIFKLLIILTLDYAGLRIRMCISSVICLKKVFEVLKRVGKGIEIWVNFQTFFMQLLYFSHLLFTLLHLFSKLNSVFPLLLFLCSKLPALYYVLQLQNI